MKIITFCTSRPVSVLAAATGILLFGTLAFFHLGVELLPNLKIPLVRVATIFPGMAAEEVENLVTRPLENALSPVRGLRGMQSVSKEEVSLVDLRFDWAADPRLAATEVREKVDALYPYLPSGIERPLVVTQDLNAEPVVILALSPAEGRDLQEIGELAKGEVAAALARIPGVAGVNVFGAGKEEILVQADREKLASSGMSIHDLIEVIAGAAVDRPLGKIQDGGREQPVKASSGLNSAEGLRKLPLAPRYGVAGGLFLGDLARVSEGPGPLSSFFLAQGKSCLGLYISGTPEAGSRGVARAVRKELPALRERYHREMDIQIVADTSREIDAALGGLPLAAALGILSVMAVLGLIFGGLGLPLIVSASIPLCCAASFLFMHFTGMSLNIISLSGMTLGIGMIVDNSIVVAEALLGMKNPSAQEVAEQVRDTALATFPSTMTTILVFLPIAFIPGIVGALFFDLAAVLSFLLMASLFFSLSLTPALFLLCCPSPVRRERDRRSGPLDRIYRCYLIAVFRKPWMLLVILFLILIPGIGSFPRLTWSIMPRRDPGRLELTAVFPTGTEINETLEASKLLCRRFQDIPEVVEIRAEAGGDPDSPIHRGEAGRNPWTVRFSLSIRGRPWEEMAKKIAPAVQGTAVLRSGPAPPDDAVSRLLGAEKGFSFRLSGADRGELLQRAEDLVQDLGEEGLLQEFFFDTEKSLPRIDFKLDPEKTAFHGVGSGEALETLRSSLRGRLAAIFRRDDREIEVRVQLAGNSFSESPELSKILLPGRGGPIPAGEIGSFARGFSFPELHRTDRSPSVSLHLSPVPGMESALEKRLQGEAQGELLSRSGLKAEAGSALRVFLLAVLLMYLLLGAQFESFSLPLLLLLSFPLSAAGSFPLLLAMGYSLNINSFLGILILLGTTINSPILLTAAYGTGGARRIIEESLRRLRPLAATVATTLTALTPVLLNQKGENILQSNTAASLAGGLAAGTAAILLVYPPLYFFTLRQSERKK